MSLSHLITNCGLKSNYRRSIYCIALFLISVEINYSICRPKSVAQIERFFKLHRCKFSKGVHVNKRGSTHTAFQNAKQIWCAFTNCVDATRADQSRNKAHRRASRSLCTDERVNLLWTQIAHFQTKLSLQKQNPAYCSRNIFLKWLIM